MAHRYRVTPGAVLDELGATCRQVQPDLPALIRAYPAGFARAGLDPSRQAARSSTRGTVLERLDARYWADIRCRRTGRWASASRYCPACLTDTGAWADTWQHPYHLVCTFHGLLLEAMCPRCGTQQFAKPTWLTHDGKPTACHGFIDAPSGTRYRQRCDTDLAQTPAVQAHPDLLAAQQWLWQVVDADAAGEPVTVIGLPVEAATVYDSAAEIITANTLEVSTHELRFPEEHGLLVAYLLLTQPSVRAAAELAPHVRGFHPQEGAAPIGPRYKVTHRPRNPVITAISLQQHHGRLTVSAELKFRLGTAAPSYPPAWHVKTSALTPSAELPELPMAVIPSTLWPGVISLGDPTLDAEHGVDTPLGRAFAAIALARFASTRSWRLLAVNLGLPAHCASTGARHWHALDRAGHWPTYVFAIARVFEQLHACPPPIDYERRRITAGTDRVLAEARRVVTAHPALGAGRRRFARALWAVYTGGDPGFAPTILAGPTAEVSPTWGQALTEAAQKLGKPSGEPLTWHPP